jgi:hypothetical protein
MAIAFLAPTATCSLVGSSAADVKGYVWFSVSSASDQSACCAFYAGSSTADKHLWSMTATSGHLLMAAMVGPFRVDTSEVYADLTGTRASALIATASY